MKIKEAGCVGVALLVSASVASPAIANPDDFIPIWGAVPPIESEVDADKISGTEKAAMCATGTLDYADGHVQPVAQTSAGCDSFSRQVFIGPGKLVATLHRGGQGIYPIRSQHRVHISI